MIRDLDKHIFEYIWHLYYTNQTDNDLLFKDHVLCDPSVWQFPKHLIEYDKLVFESGRDGNPEIYTINPVTGKGLKRLTNNKMLDEWPSFSKDGSLIAWVRGVEGDKNIWVMNKDGRYPRQISYDINIGDGFPSFSPDGSELLFQSNSEEEPASINIINLDGSDLRKIGEGFFPNWSPFLD